MDQHANLLLSAEVLRRDTGLVRGQSVGGTFALKRVASQTYLIVDRLQAGVLAEFAQPKNVPQALENCIRDRKCPPLPKFYDLILKAHRAGLLRSEELCPDAPVTIERPPVRWFIALPPRLSTVLLSLGLLGAVGYAFIRWGAVLPGHALDFLCGWLAVCGALSLGEVLAAGALRGAGCEVHHPHLRWLTLTPHFAVDQADTCMADRLGRATIHAVSWVPLALTTLAALWLRAPWALLPLAALFLACRPFGTSPFARLLTNLRRTPLLSTDTTPLFDAELTLTERLRERWRRFDSRVAALQFLAAVGWTFALGSITYSLLNLRFTDLLRDWSHWEKTLLVLASGLFVVGLLWFTAEVQSHALGTARAVWQRLRLTWRRLRQPVLNPATDFDAVEALIRNNPLLGRLDPMLQWELAQCCRPFVTRRWRTLVRFEDSPGFVTLIVSGRAHIYRRLKSGRKERFLRVQEGDLFGAHHLVDATNARLEIRAATRLVALTISTADFQRLVIDRLGTPTVSAYLLKHLFLQNSSPLCAGWRPSAIARFVDLTDTASHSAGGRILARGQEVPSLYVLYEGHAQARDKQKRTSPLQPGDFFGEISLLQTSAASADVEAREEARSLVVNRVEFIRFLTRNHHVALQMERLCSRRLGRPIFPLERTAFDER
jgi:CRP-like cAMP-binding protein